MTCRHRTPRSWCLNVLVAQPVTNDRACAVCPHYDGPARGAGDVVHRVLERTGVAKVVKALTRKGCNCATRRAALNSAIPLKPPVDDSR